MSQFLLYITYINFNICCILFIILSCTAIYYCCKSDVLDLIVIFKALSKEYVAVVISKIKLLFLEIIKTIDNRGA